QDAGVREVFRGDLSQVELAAGLLEEHGIEFQRRWEQAGGASFSIGETALLPGRPAVLLVPSIAYDEAVEVLTALSEPEPDYLTDLSAEVTAGRIRRRTVARVVAIIMLTPMAIWLLLVVGGFLYAAFQHFMPS
ncbi:MAG TPA: hypothetical protein VM733_00540, partial [Thermoanaerobaculia bacterium]|nr:hypothetical protein [Thermoanaerobaculia bacterium]